MKDATVVAVATSAAFLGVLIDGLLRVEPWGAGFVVVAATALVLVVGVSVRAGRRMTAATITLAAGSIVCGAMVALRDSPTLVAFDLVFCALLAVVIPASVTGRRLARLGPMEWVMTTMVAAVEALLGAAVYLVRDVPWRRVRKAPVGRPVLAITRGVVLAVPPLLVFGALLASADPVFSHVLTELLRIDLVTLFSHLVLFSIGTWLALGWLSRAGGETPPIHLPLDLDESKKVGIAETAIVLGAIDTLFAGFVAVQFRYFFGGADLVAAVPGLTRAEYARSGFFELVTVAALVLLLLLFVDWAVVRTRRSLAVTRSLAALQIALVAVMLTSAWLRMQLYVEEFGLTELRLYTIAFMIWLAVVLVWFCGTVLVGRRERFASGAIALAVAALVGLNVANPDAMIVRVNVERAERGGTFDADYLGRLSADAVPAIVDGIETRSPDLAAELERGLARRAPGGHDWRTWNLSRARAGRILRSIRGVRDDDERRDGSWVDEAGRSVRSLHRQDRRTVDASSAKITQRIVGLVEPVVVHPRAYSGAFEGSEEAIAVFPRQVRDRADRALIPENGVGK